MKTLRIVSADMGTAESLQTMLIRGKQFHVLPVLRGLPFRITIFFAMMHSPFFNCISDVCMLPWERKVNKYQPFR